MKYCKRFTEGLGYFALFLVLVFIAFSYFTFDKTTINEETGELLSVFDGVRGFREYLKLFGFLGGALIISSFTDRLPYVGLIVSFIPVYYIFKLYAQNQLVFCPMIIMILAIFFLVGELVASVQWTNTKLNSVKDTM